MEEKMPVGERKLTDGKLKELRKLFIEALEEEKEQEEGKLQEDRRNAIDK